MSCLWNSSSLFLVLLFCFFRFTQSGKVLVLPGEYSHWHNMRFILEELVERNHSVTVLVHAASPSIKYNQTERFKFLVIDSPLESQKVHALSEEMIDLWINQSRTSSTLGMALKIMDLASRIQAVQKVLCDSVFRNEELLATLKSFKFDVLLFDPMIVCGDLLAEVLKVPFVISLRLSLGYSMERLCGQMPAPPSYVPISPGQFTDRMSFVERVYNLVLYVFYNVAFQSLAMGSLNKYYSEILGKPTTLCDTMGKADIWLIRTYWDFEYPRPFLPNFKFVGGLHCKPAKPLPKEMEEFVQSSGDAGIVVFSLGSLIKNLSKERANTIASALGQIPQKVLWSYLGEKPDTLAPNTRMYDWIPQNDLLGHPKTKAFITHGGTNGLYEAIYHGVPMVGLPLFADQPDNMNHMRTKGAAVMLDINRMESKDLKEALIDVINNPLYKENIMRLSRIHHDQPMKPLDRAVFWIEFVMRNNGAKHLRVEAHNLTWYQYHCLDVATFLLSITALVMFIFVKTCSWIFRKCLRRTTTKNKKE
ncbi:UDP-glucuronosyltransferase 2B20-like isoform X1 [Electrophorus electricus]|uniref:UDP-glucuronosyltransferase 2B20-like isoform X1 n=1 Tax=Electrophorus electricus TaxID=8005 RepID=UPI0015D01E67|nr:UDP-glucuronosyltransferase 2B20-like isoform X1 [Electrophorus electricus]